MQEAGYVLRELLFAISQGKGLPESAEAFSIIRHGLDSMDRLVHQMEERDQPVKVSG
jgi:hypothetical protein